MTSFLLSAVVASSAPALAGVDLVQNGDFEMTTAGGGQLGYNTDATDWTTTGYNFLFPSGSADTTGVIGSDGNLQLWGPNNGSANGLPASSPDGGNFVAMDGDYETAPITQTISGLTAGQTYVVSFDYGYAQQAGFLGDTNQNITVCLGTSCATTPTLTNPSQGFTGWFTASYDLTADGTSDVLSFLAFGSVPVPPFALVDSVSLNAVPEPSTWAMMGLGFGGLGFAAYRRRAKFVARAIA